MQRRHDPQVSLSHLRLLADPALSRHRARGRSRPDISVTSRKQSKTCQNTPNWIWSLCLMNAATLLAEQPENNYGRVSFTCANDGHSV